MLGCRRGDLAVHSREDCVAVRSGTAGSGPGSPVGGRGAAAGPAALSSAGPAAAADAARPAADPVPAAPAAAGLAAGRSRRSVLAATVASLPLLAVTGCQGVGALAAPPRAAPDVAVLRAAIAAEELMIARYDIVITRSARLAAGLRPLRAEHRLHLAELRSRLIVPPGSQAAAARPAHSRPAAARPGRGPAAAISFLQGAERASAANLLRHLAAVSPSLAQLMASIAASEATHVAALAAAGDG
jgi:hypothetical protein